MRETVIKKWIINFLNRQWAFCEWQQWWKIVVSNWENKKDTAITMQSRWTPDIICFIQWYFIWIETKKDQEEVDEWLKIESLFNQNLPIPKWKDREIWQIIKKILMLI